MPSRSFGLSLALFVLLLGNIVTAKPQPGICNEDLDAHSAVEYDEFPAYFEKFYLDDNSLKQFRSVKKGSFKVFQEKCKELTDISIRRNFGALNCIKFLIHLLPNNVEAEKRALKNRINSWDWQQSDGANAGVYSRSSGERVYYSLLFITDLLNKSIRLSKGKQNNSLPKMQLARIKNREGLLDLLERILQIKIRSWHET